MKIKNVKFNKDKLFFTSDTHFFHKNIIKYCDRPFDNVEEMNAKIVENWNKVVPKDGVVFHLGDVSLTGGSKRLSEILMKLNGTIHLITGNHERDALDKEYIRTRWESINDLVEIEVEDEEITYGKQQIVMCHYPMIAWNGSHRGTWQLFGHVHGGLSNKGIIKHAPTQIDMGVDCHNFTPVSYQQVKEIITQQHLKKEIV